MLRIIAAPLFEGRPEITITRDIVKYAMDNNIPYSYISDGVYPVPQVGAVYNDEVLARYYLKVTQTVIDQIKDGDILFWCDLWNPALTSLFHYCTSKHIKVKNYGIWHSSPITAGDYLYGSDWAVDFQTHLLKYVDGLVVATNYMKDMCITPELVGDKSIADKIKVTGLPLDLSVIKNHPNKQNTIVFCHRWADDKRPDSFVKQAKRYKEMGSDLKFIVFSPNKNIRDSVTKTCLDNGVDPNLIECVPTKDKADYYDKLGYVKYIWADSVLETFGYSILEGYLSGAIPVLNDMPCYKELYPLNCYSNNEELDKIISTEFRGDYSMANIVSTCVANMYKFMGIV